MTRGSSGGRVATRRASSAHASAWLAVAMLLLALVAPAMAAELRDESDLERRVKAAFIYQFIPYVEWPAKAFADGEAPIVVAVVGSEQAVAELQDVIGKRAAQGRPVVIRRWRDGDLNGGAQVVFVTRAQRERLPAIAGAAQASAALVVAEQDNGLDQGAMINFRLVDGRVRFDVALGTAEHAGLRISSRLLAVAQSVRPPS